MKEITLKVPDEFDEKKIEFIKKSAMNQIEAFLKATLSVPQEQVDAVNLKIKDFKDAMGIVDEQVIEEPEIVE
uniref:Uncharacterized protein n=1 Tax=viral metagenome TaxID=1070528 RepID=A0A6M3KSR2_9ZZZZ